MSTVIEARSVSRSYGSGATRFDALTDVSLTVRRGQSLGIVGRSGSGKSTLMHILAALDRPTRGAVQVAGADTSSMTAREVDLLRNRTFGFVFQQFFLTPGATVLDNVMLPLTVAGTPRREAGRRASAVLERLGLGDKARNRATQLSGGQKQRVAIARALVGEPSVIFADEPTGNLDTETGAMVEDLLLGLVDDGITVVLVTHDPDLAARCSRQVRISDGRITATTTGTARRGARA